MRRGFINARFYQNDKPAVLVDDGHFITFGTDAEIEKITGFDEVIDLCGMYVWPGFVDSHMHLAELGMYMNEVQLKTCADLDAVEKRLRAAQKGKESSQWLIARGWIERSPSSIPDKKFLDSVCGQQPAALMRSDGHVMTVNSAALKLAGIDGDVDMEGGHLDFKRGIVRENAMKLITGAQPRPDEKTIQKYIEDGARLANSYGITSVGSDDFLSIVRDWRPVLNVMEKMSYQEKLTVRVNEQCEFSSPEEYASFLDDGYSFDVGNDFFRIGPLKLVTDGSLGAHTAFLSRPYLNDGSNRGMMIMDEETIETFVRLAHHFNTPVIAHAIGDSAVDILLDIFKENTWDLYQGNPLHDGLVHCQILRKDQIERILEYRLSCYFQSAFIEEDASLLENVDKELRQYSYPFRTLYEGTLSSNGSDAPVELPNVLKGMMLAETQRSSSGKPLNPKEALTRRQAFDSYTTAGCRQLFINDRAGSFKEGYLADFVVTDKDILHCSLAELADTKIMMTVMNGSTVYEKSNIGRHM